jgi:hypothetical protein
MDGLRSFLAKKPSLMSLPTLPRNVLPRVAMHACSRSSPCAGQALYIRVAKNDTDSRIAPARHSRSRRVFGEGHGSTYGSRWVSMSGHVPWLWAFHMLRWLCCTKSPLTRLATGSIGSIWHPAQDIVCLMMLHIILNQGKVCFGIGRLDFTSAHFRTWQRFLNAYKHHQPITI